MLFINCTAGIVFYSDKHKAKKNKFRVPEAFLHLLELLGGIFTIIPMIFIIRHKNKKISYNIFSFLILILWIFFLCVLALHSNEIINFADQIIK